MQKLEDGIHDGKNVLADLPNLAMDHKLTQVRFWVKTTSSNYTTYGYGTGENQKKFRITELKLTQVPTNWTLTVADKATSNNAEGQLTPQTNLGHYPAEELSQTLFLSRKVPSWSRWKDG